MRSKGSHASCVAALQVVLTASLTSCAVLYDFEGTGGATSNASSSQATAASSGNTKASSQAVSATSQQTAAVQASVQGVTTGSCGFCPPKPPPPFSGPVSFLSSKDQPSCSGTLLEVKQVEAAPAECGCQCQTKDECHVTLTPVNGICGAPGQPVLLHVSQGQTSSCVGIVGDTFHVSAVSISDGPCTAQPSVTLPTPVITHGVGCPSSDASCAEGCFVAGERVCVFAGGDQPCPGEYPQFETWYKGYADKRGCQGCQTCIEERNCSGVVRYFPDPTCQAPPTSQVTTVDFPECWSALGFAQSANFTPTQAPTCSSDTPVSIGAIELQDRITVCCMQ